MSYIGYFGDIVFSVDQDRMLTPKDYEREGGSRWNEHNLLLRKPVSQFAGPELEKLKFKIILDVCHGIEPETQLKALREIRDNGIVLPLVINSKPITQNYWRLDNLRESNNILAEGGWLIHCEAELNLIEYDDSDYIESQANSLSRLFSSFKSLF